jgi:large subunit ribosomal protein L17
MKHGIDGRQFGRNTGHRVAMLRNMANSLIREEQIVTTVQKAKEARRVVDRLITLAKKGSEHHKRLAYDRTRDKVAVEKLFTVLADRYKARNGGYTRVLRLSDLRRGDAAQMAVLELVDHPPIDRKRKPKAETAAADGAQAQSGAVDPFSGFRKLFSGSRKKQAKAPAAPGEAKEVKATVEKSKKAPTKKATAKKEK